METIAWNNELVVNVKVFDDDHKKMIVLANDLIGACDGHSWGSEQDSVLRELKAIAFSNSEHESDLAKLYHYPGVFSHDSNHDDQRDFLERLERMPNASKASVSTADNLRNWLVSHIRETDKALGIWLNGKGVY